MIFFFIIYDRTENDPSDSTEDGILEDIDLER